MRRTPALNDRLAKPLSPKMRSLLVCLLLAMAACLGNFYYLPLFLGIDFLFGSIAVLTIAYLYGAVWATVAAVIAELYTILWGQPFSAIVLVLEAALMGWQLQVRRRSLVMLDSLFWIGVGMPLIGLFFFYGLHASPATVLVIMLKQAVNGIFNALIADLLIAHTPLIRLARSDLHLGLSLRRTLLNLFVAFVFFPALSLTVLNSRQALIEIETDVPTHLNFISLKVAGEVRRWQQENQTLMQRFAEMTAQTGVAPSIALQQGVELMQQSLAGSQQVIVRDRLGKTIAAYPPAVPVESPLASAAFQVVKHDSGFVILQQVAIAKGQEILGSVSSQIYPSAISQLLKDGYYSLELKITLLDEGQQVLSTTRSDLPILGKFDHSQDIPVVGKTQYHWLPSGNMPTFERGQQSFYVQTTPIGSAIPWTLVVEAPAAPHLDRLQTLYIHGLALTLLIAVLAIAFANLVSRRLARPILQLASVTTNLPDKLLEQAAIGWPHSSIIEVRSLVSNFKDMASSLERQFQEIQTANGTLEQRIADRTQALLTTNQELQTEVAERQRVAEALQQSETQLRQQTVMLEQTLENLQQAQTQLVQTEKMSSLGQLVAGVAHEINNPVNFIHGNLRYAKDYIQAVLKLLQLYQQQYPATPQIQQAIAEADIGFVQADLPKLLQSMQIGADRIRDIVRSLRNFSRLDEAEVKAVDIHEGLDSTLMILQSRLKARETYPGIAVVKAYGDLPLVECFPGQLNQVFMNLLVNAIDALEEQKAEISEASTPTIQIRTELSESEQVKITIADNAAGISPEVRSRLFDPFFTTKPIGKGTGMGLSISYQIVTEKHRGQMFCHSELGKGAAFVIQIPVRQAIE